jgi:hypothetical protein
MHFELRKVKVATIKLLHEVWGLHLKRRHFEHKCYNKHSLKNWKLWKIIFNPSCKLEKKNFYHLQIFYYTSLKFHLKLTTMRETLFDILETSHFQQLKGLSSTHLKRSMNRKTLFHTLSPWNLIFSKNLKNKFFTLEKLTTLWRNLFHTSHSLRNGLLFYLQPCKLKAFPQKDFPFLCYTS